MKDRQTQIEQYLNGQLSGAELAAFEAALTTDPQLADDLALYRETSALLRLGEVMEFEKDWKKFKKENSSKEHFSWAKLVWAGLAVVAAALLLYWFLRTPEAVAEQLPLPIAVDTSTVNSNPNVYGENGENRLLKFNFQRPIPYIGELETYPEIKAAFLNEDYSSVLAAIRSQAINPELAYYRAVCFISLGERKDTDIADLKLATSNEILKWYAKAYLFARLPEGEEANKILQELRAPESPFREAIDKLMN